MERRSIVPNCSVSGECPHCGKNISQNVWYTIPEDRHLQQKEMDDKFWRSFLKGLFIFGLTGLLFTWSLVLMTKEYDIKRLGMLLARPEVQFEETIYSCQSKDVNADVSRVVRPSLSEASRLAEEVKRLSETNIRLQGNLDKATAELKARSEKK